jgi:uncharacterized protein involved in exopolysaccharide biosynthesis
MQKNEIDFLDLRTVVRVLWKSKVLVVALSLGAAAAFFGLTYLMTPTYRVTTVVADASEMAGSQALLSSLGQFGSLATLAGVNLGSEVRPSEEALAVLESGDFLNAFLNNHGLLPVLYADQWDKSAKTWRKDLEADKRPTTEKAIRKFRKLLVVNRDRRNSLITLSLTWKDPAVAEAWCRDLIDDINAEMQQRALVRARNYIAYLRQQMDRDSTIETRQAIGRLLETQLKQEMLASVSKDYAFRVVSRARQPERDDFASPKRGLFFVLGFMFGFGIAVIVAYVRFKPLSQPETSG